MRLLSKILTLALLALALTACGKKSDLTLPATEHATLQSSLSLHPLPSDLPNDLPNDLPAHAATF
jgi:predicted small lipoprotein YifL